MVISMRDPADTMSNRLLVLLVKHTCKILRNVARTSHDSDVCA